MILLFPSSLDNYNRASIVSLLLLIMSINGTKTLNLKDNNVQIINGKSAPTQKTHQVINPATLGTIKRRLKRNCLINWVILLKFGLESVGLGPSC